MEQYALDEEGLATRHEYTHQAYEATGMPKAFRAAIVEGGHDYAKPKRELAAGISNPGIDKLYNRALKAGALGGKILGAGGGGFLMIFCEPKTQNKVKTALKELTCVPVKLEPQGSKIIYVEDIER